MKLKGKAAIVTGASRGIGRAIARLFAEEGADIAVNYNESREDAQSLGAELEELGARVLVLKADISTAGDVDRMVNLAHEKFGHIDILVNNAGIWIPFNLLKVDEAVWDRTLAVNLKGPLLCTKAVSPIMIRQKSGKIINISSVAGLHERSAVLNAAYATSKAGLIGLTRSSAVNLGPYINVNVVCPSVIETDMSSSLPVGVRRLQVEESVLKREGTPRNVADAVLFLASEDSNFITGETLIVSGGRPLS